MRTILTCFLVVLFSLTAFADKPALNNSQIALRDSISSCLQEEGFRPTISDDGTIIFKYEGKLLEIKVEESWKTPRLVVLSLKTKLDKKDALYYHVVNDINNYYMLKVRIIENATGGWSLDISSNIPVNSAMEYNKLLLKDIIPVVPKVLSVFDKKVETLRENEKK